MISTTNSSKYKLFSITNFIFFLLIVPKINLLDISNYHQGIRVENLISIVLFLLILFNPKNFKINDDFKFYLFCGIIFLSFSIGVVNNVPILAVTIIRIFEYIVFVIFFSNFKLDYKKIIIFCKFLIIINLIVSFLQYHEILGFFSSKGYYGPDSDLWESAGIFSGSWELSFITSILYFLIYHNDKKKFSIYFILTVIILYLANTRGVIIPFFISIIFLYLGKFKINIFYLVILSSVAYGSYFFVLKYLDIDFLILFESLIRMVFLNQNMFSDFSTVKNEYYSWAYRMEFWTMHANMFNQNIFTNLFGTGYTSIYYESFIFRILFANGIIGLAVLCIFALRMKLYIIIFLLMTGFSLDFVASFKMFIVLFLYFKCLKLLKK
tara:strand:- start:2242 stop:3384 length:1143 start_codon:yes stop_codon:yes gene_type:complete